MLKGLDPLLNAELLGVLSAMGHGDDIVLADSNFPATTMAKRLVRMPGISAPRVLEAVLSVMPLDDFVDEPCGRIEVVGDPYAVPEVCRDFQEIIDREVNGGIRLARIERFEFYRRAREAFAVVQTGETRLYGCILLKMGVVRPD
ncbi:MAG: RbsD/FucU domain-containing protein [Alphaproteobacteria bacterium]